MKFSTRDFAINVAKVLMENSVVCVVYLIASTVGSKKNLRLIQQNNLGQKDTRFWLINYNLKP